MTFEIKNKYTLYINPLGDNNNNINNDIINYYIMLEQTCLNTDTSGIDLIIPHDITINYGMNNIDHHIKCCMIENTTGLSCGYHLYPLLSIYNYPIIANNTIINASYTDSIISTVRCIDINADININKGNKLFEICAPDLSPLRIKVIR